jgi:putative SOS response-associated peptidase YedK
MCGRITVRAGKAKLEETFAAEATAEIAVRHNLASTEATPVMLQEGPRRVLTAMRWGFEGRSGLLINARSETAADKPSFAGALARRRCIVAADGFYEWKRTGKVRQPFLIERLDHAPFALAALWEPETTQRTLSGRCCILTTEANDLLRPLHDRMPVVLAPEQWDQWLLPTDDVNRLKPLLRPTSTEGWHLFPVSTAVNRAGYDAPDCWRATEESQPSLF